MKYLLRRYQFAESSHNAELIVYFFTYSFYSLKILSGTWNEKALHLSYILIWSCTEIWPIMEDGLMSRLSEFMYTIIILHMRFCGYATQKY